MKSNEKNKKQNEIQTTNHRANEVDNQPFNNFIRRIQLYYEPWGLVYKWLWGEGLKKDLSVQHQAPPAR